MTDTVAVIADSQQRRQALDPHQSFIIQAPAGSGKTELLTRRFLTLLATVESPEEIVAITFTRKAAAEMRGRIINALQDVNANPDSEIGKIARAALAHDQSMQWQLLDHPSRLRIQTIDSLCRTLTQQMPVLSRFGAQPELLGDASEHYRTAARHTLAHLDANDAWSKPIACLLTHLDNNWPVAEQLLVVMLGRRDQWLRHVADIKSQPDLRALLENALQEAIAAALSKLRTNFPRHLVAELLALSEFAATNLKLDSPAHPLVPCVALSELPGDEWSDLALWCALSGLLLTTSDTWRIQIDKRNGFPAPSSTSDKAKKTLYQNMKERFKSLVTELESFEPLQRQLIALHHLPSPHYSETQWQVLSALTELLPLAAAELLLVFRQHNRVDFTEISLAAIHALGAPQAPSDLALSWDYRIRHLLVDEFQDTSFSQYLLLERLTAGWQPDDGRTLFLVGDPMQSIYRFREANVGLFLWARRNGIGALHLTPLTLSVNFRSEQIVIDWINDTFQQLMPAQEDTATGAVCYSPSSAVKPATSLKAVHVHPSFEHSPAQEAETVANIVYDAQKAHPQCKIAILVRARAHLAQIILSLRAAQISYRAVEIEQLKSSPIIQDLIALTRALLHPADRVAWLALLRAPWCGLTLADMTQLLAREKYATLWSLLQNKELVAQLSEDGQCRLNRFLKPISVSMDARQRTTLRNRIESTWLALGGPACARNANDIEEALVYFSMLESLDEGATIPTIERLEERVDKLFAIPDPNADDSLQLMTIHKAKGLEFDVVILPGLGRRPANDESRLLLWMEQPGSRAGADLLLAPIKQTGAETDKIYGYLRFIEREKNIHETSRLLYVATTRAKQELHLLGHTTLESVEAEKKDHKRQFRPPHSGSLLAHLWPAVKGEFEQAHSGSTNAWVAARPNTPFDQAIRRLTRDWQLPTPAPGIPVRAQSEPRTLEPIEFFWASNTIRHIGTIVHRYLRRIAHQGVSVWDSKRIAQQRPAFAIALRQLGVPAPDLDSGVAKIEQALVNVCNDKKGQWMLSNEHCEADSEFALTGRLHDTLINVIVDRTFVDAEGIRWIIDYKTSAHEGGDTDVFLAQEQTRYRSQMERYAMLFQQYGPHPIRLGLYFPLLTQWREWSFSAP